MNVHAGLKLVGCVLPLALLLLVARAKTQAPEPLATRAAFLKMIARPRVPLTPELKKLEANAGLEQWHFTYAAFLN